jgi:hyperosmotically inducible protein
VKTILTSLLLGLALSAGSILARNPSTQTPARVPQQATAAAKQAMPKPAVAPVTDANITAAVKDKLSKTPSLKDANINVSTKDGVVTLTGMLKNGGLKGVATNVTKSVKGVRKVDNQITIEPKAKAAGVPK